MEIATRHFVRPEYMNHHNSLYAGYISEWITEAAFIGMAKVMGRTSHFVLAAVRGINVTRSVYTGSVLEGIFSPVICTVREALFLSM